MGCYNSAVINASADKVLPVTTNGSTFVEWTSTWDSGNGVAEFCDPIYQALLSDLAQHMR